MERKDEKLLEASSASAKKADEREDRADA
jgi:hypothetical protein